MTALPSDLRKSLEKAVTDARRLAEAAARASLERLGVGSERAPAGLSEGDRRLRRQLDAKVEADTCERVVESIAYVGWHRMLFARFLAENGLLRHPDGASVSLAEVREIAAEEGERDPWVLAARYAAAMLPGIFGTGDPIDRVAFAPEDRQRLERVLEGLPADLFTADDALGWVYQFWQSERKKEVNKRGDKIGGVDLPPVTQLFTEDYMVRFLLENSLGAWWAGRHPQSPLLKRWEYLRFRDDGTPAVGTFEGWPTRAAEVTMMDPCCGSGHFLVAAAGMLRDMRIEEEGLSPAQAAAAVIADNIHGLELDPRCLQLAAFNLALDAWKAGGYQELPIPALACSGIPIKGQRNDWHRLAGDDANMRDALDRLYDLFQDAPELGSLIDPRAAAGEGIWRVDVDQLLDRLDQALARETESDPAAAVFGDAAKGTAKAARLLADRYWLVATNPPFLTLKKAGSVAATALSAATSEARFDFATGLLQRWMRSLNAGALATFVTPTNWLYLASYRTFRHLVVTSWRISLIAIAGMAFDNSGASIAGIGLFLTSTGQTSAPLFDVEGSDAVGLALRQSPALTLRLSDIAADTEARLMVRQTGLPRTTLAVHARANGGMQASDAQRFIRVFWEPRGVAGGWVRQQNTVSRSAPYGGREHVLLWEDGQGALWRFIQDWEAAGWKSGVWRAGQQVWGKHGVLVSLMGTLPVTLYTGHAFHQNTAAVIPTRPEDLPAIYAFCSSESFVRLVREIDRSLKVTGGTVVKVPFDLEHWTKVAQERYPDGLPEPHSDDPTQWLFKGTVPGSEAPLQVAVARLLGYRWPDQEPDALDELADADGLVPLTPVAGERSAADRLRELLARAYGDAWSPALLERLLAEAGSPGATLEAWLREDFFTQHTKLFHHRPFVWHVWDGRKDGFSVLCHYHRLDRARLEKLTYTLLGDWVERQRAAGDEPGAEPRLNAALDLQDRLKLIIEGEAPHDVYVRWKPMAEQPMGWEPDLDDGVRLNIRPFVTAGVLRARVNVKWDKDRGKDPDGSERINDLHPTLAEKRVARAAGGG